MNKIRHYLILASVLLLVFAGLGVLGAQIASKAEAAPSESVWSASVSPAPAMQAAPLPAATCTLVGATRTCDLWAKTGVLALPGASVPISVPIWGFADTAAGAAGLPGPVMIANQGETLEVILHNDLLNETVALAFPGLESWQPDLIGVATGVSRTYSLTLSSAGTYLYEAGMTANGPRQVAMGLFGALIVRPVVTWPGDLTPTVCITCAYTMTTTFDGEALLVLSEIDPALNAAPTSFRLENFAAKYWLINGKVYPQTQAIAAPAGSTVLLRYVNASSTHHTMGLLGLQQKVVAADGVLFTWPHMAVAELVWPGQSVEALVQIPATAVAGARYALYDTGLYLHNAGLRLSLGGPTAFGGMLTFIQAATGGAPAGVGPVVTAASVAPARTNGAGSVTFSATIDESTTGGQNVTAAEYWIDTSAAISIPVTPGVVVNVSVVIPALDLAALPSGDHTLYVRGQDTDLNWGAAGSAILKLDKVGPAISGMSLTPNPTNNAAVNIQATGDEGATGGGNVVTATYTIDGGAAQPMTLSTTTAPVASLTATIAQATVAALAEGQHPIAITSQDDLGNPGTPGVITLMLDRTGPATPVVVVTPATLILVPPSATSVRVDATITDVLTAGVQSKLATAEGFVDVAGAPGTGFAMFPADGLFDEVSEGVYYNIPVANFSQLTSGPHPIYVRGKDAAGNWGPLASGTININNSAAIVLYFSTFGNTNPPGVTGTADDADIYAWNGTSFSRVFDATNYGLPSGANVDGYVRVDATHFYLSFSADTTVPGIGSVQDEDVVYYNNGGWSVYFDGTAQGLTAANQDLDAFDIVGGVLYFSTLGNTNPPGVTGTADDADIYSWNGTAFSRVWDASANGLPSGANVDGYVRVDATHFYLSFSADTTVPGIGSVQDEDVVYYNNGVWSVYFDGTAPGLTANNQDLDAFDIP